MLPRAERGSRQCPRLYVNVENRIVRRLVPPAARRSSCYRIHQGEERFLWVVQGSSKVIGQTITRSKLSWIISAREDFILAFLYSIIKPTRAVQVYMVVTIVEQQQSSVVETRPGRTTSLEEDDEYAASHYHSHPPSSPCPEIQA